MIYKVFHKYEGYFVKKQLEYYKKKLKNKFIWLLRYKDPKTRDDYTYVNFEDYFTKLMKEIDGFNELLCRPKDIPKIMSLLEAAKMELQQEEFDWETFRCFVLDAHALIDFIGEEVEAS